MMELYLGLASALDREEAGSQCRLPFPEEKTQREKESPLLRANVT